MLRTRNEQPSLWESTLPEVCLRLPAELERVDARLDDERFFTPFGGEFSWRCRRRRRGRLRVRVAACSAGKAVGR